MQEEWVMKNILLSIFLVGAAVSSFAEAPFGLKVGMSLAEVKKVSGPAEVLEKNYYSFKNVPIPYKGFKDYLMVITPKSGLCKVLGFGNPITTSVYGDGVKAEFSTLKESLIKKYGKPIGDYDFLRAGSIWKNPNEWMMSLYREERILTAAWEPKEDNGVENIMLKARATGRSTGVITLSYELSNNEACLAEKESRDISGL
ncbi:hypothetical protein [Acinetobacter lwoffii]|uniref:hypothetical protein n=1 Tax=Acinetobacter lwoffii TaxID=28090 RepID=UPI002DB9B5B4|nr:hypothetical protein [Acinetobacter lwoffii]MEB6679903.1 hypothetical protein [Acinetobacter lwoffii]